jgi:hypothetical protein
MRVFCGWGDKGPSDHASQIDEPPEENESTQVIPLRLFGPAALCIALGIALFFLPSLRMLSLSASSSFLSQGAFIDAIYGRPHTETTASILPGTDIGSMVAHGLASVLLALILAAWAVFHRSLPRKMRWPSHLEGSMRWARLIQSGQPADYVVWAMAGIAALGGLFLTVR